ncbi:molybdenum cofactor guanylyltransferase MobA [Amaricoccus macauensis]|uniref:molybdenum cofactor guanylyltransferase MobA n=1 Tax=Amaricoccus macauensis TaxID=57001 RepID=UPI003C7A50C2
MHLAPSDPIAGVILAGGLSRRMGGGDKCRVVLGGQSLLAHVKARLSPQCAALALNANGDPARFADTGLPVIADSIADRPGPLAGILAGLDWAHAQGFTRIVTAAADTPFLPLDLVAALSNAPGSGPIRLAASTDGALHPVFGIWPTDLRDQLRRDISVGARKVRAWAEAQGALKVANWGEEAFFNINTPEDLEAARIRARSGR